LALLLLSVHRPVWRPIVHHTRPLSRPGISLHRCQRLDMWPLNIVYSIFSRKLILREQLLFFTTCISFFSFKTFSFLKFPFFRLPLSETFSFWDFPFLKLSLVETFPS
jgi:hypothetical protein